MNARKVRLVKGDDNACPKCGSTNIVVRTYADTVDFRDLELNVEGLQDSKCVHCEHVWVTSDQTTHSNALLRVVYATERDRLRAAQGLLSGPDIARVREQLGLKQREAASLFGGGPNAFNKYESGEVLQSFAMDRLLRLSEVIGIQAVAFLKNVYSLPSFVVIPLSSTYTTSGASFTQAPHIYKVGESVRRVQTSTDAAIGLVSFQYPQKGTRSFREKHETYATAR